MTDELFSVRGQVVMVSGGSRGIGRAIVAAFAERGAHVIATGRDPEALKETERLCENSGNPVQCVVCDVLNRTAIENTVEQTVAEHGRIDTLVNCAGVNRRKPALELTEEDYDHILGINLKGAFHFSRAAGQIMIGQKSGCQINIVSLNSDRPLPHVLPYAASKAALGNMTQALATEWGPHGVRVNALAPGFILTDLTNQLWADEKMKSWGIQNTPQGRLGTPQDLIGTALFLAAPASAFMTGQILYVDGGFTAGFNWPIPGSQPQ
ncbi:MAG: glucose 1-dehydrogenase [Planctomycetota bacterium]|nr:glucose 1-dehydrogenase [Planctomycetota bacterium]